MILPKTPTGLLTFILWTTLASVFIDFQSYLLPLSGLRNVDALNNLANTSSGPSELSTKCNQEPNLILAVVDKPSWQYQIFNYMNSLEMALGKSLLDASRTGDCPPALVHVRIICPEEIANNPPASYKAIMRRYPNLSFVGTTIQLSEGVVLKRFQAYSEYLDLVAPQYHRILACDLDIVFQRDPFAMPIKPEASIVYHSEWRGLKIGQCEVHQKWFDGCENGEGGPYISHEQVLSYKPRDRVCAGSVYGTAAAIRIYMFTMAEHLRLSNLRCNDQALHIHIFYSGILDAALHAAGLGGVWTVPDDESLVGTVGTTPMVLFNEWSEVLNERGDVQHVVHQYKHHRLLKSMVEKKYSWMADPGENITPKVGEMVPQMDDPHPEQRSEDFQTRFVLANVSSSTCGEFERLCSCRQEDCQYNY